MEQFGVLKRVANAIISVRQVSAQETIWVLLRAMRMYGRSCNVLKVKTNRHNERFYRIDPGQCNHEMEMLKEREEKSDNLNGQPILLQSPRLEPMRHAYIKRPNVNTFETTYRHFCEYYEIPKIPPTSKQRLQRWKLLSKGVYLKERTTVHAIRKTLGTKADSPNPRYYFSEIFLNDLWCQLNDLPNTNDKCVRAFETLAHSNQILKAAVEEEVDHLNQMELH